jgi:hypothetical protein
MGNRGLEPCAICLESIKNEKHACKKYECIHTFHNTCISNWHGHCPLCRAYKKRTPASEHASGFKSLPFDVPYEYYNTYMRRWKKTECITNNHSIFFKHTYGVIGVCETCDIVQAFNLAHPC